MKRNAAGQVAGIVLAVWLVVSVAGEAASNAQSRTGVGASNASLPSGPIRLAFRGKPGDYIAYQTKTVFHETQKQVVQGQTIKNSDKNEEQTDTTTLKVVSVLSGGVIKIERRATNSRRVISENGEKRTVPDDLENLVETYSPTWKRVSHRSLTAKAANKAEDGIGFVLFPLPSKSLRVGDTWSGKAPTSGFGSVDSISYTASLTAIEKWHGVPCARLEYRFAQDIPALLNDVKSGLLADAKVTGMPHIEGKATSYYSLDRGLPLEFQMEMRFTMDVDTNSTEPTSRQAIVTSARSKMLMKAELTATKFPAYDAKLLK